MLIRGHRSLTSSSLCVATLIHHEDREGHEDRITERMSSPEKIFFLRALHALRGDIPFCGCSSPCSTRPHRQLLLFRFPLASRFAGRCKPIHAPTSEISCTLMGLPDIFARQSHIPCAHPPTTTLP